MQRLLSLLLVLSLLMAVCGCGNIFVRGAINQPSSITGLVSIVELTGGNGTAQITLVTFLSEGTSTTVGFCGDQVNQFPLNQTVTANFRPGNTCSALVVIIIG